MIVVYCAHTMKTESLSTGELLNVMSVFLLVCIGMEQHGVYMSSNFTLGGLDSLAKNVLHSPSQIWQKEMHRLFFRMHNCMYTIKTISGYSEPAMRYIIIDLRNWSLATCN